MTGLLRDEDGQALIEYGLLVALVVMIVVGFIAAMGRKSREVFVQV